MSEVVNLLKYENSYEWILTVEGEFVAYAVSGEAYDYVEETSVRLRKLVKKLYTFPFYLHFESYYDSVADVLVEHDFDIRYKPSGRTVCTQIGRKFFDAEVPAFTVKIVNEAQLHRAFELWFQNAFNNELWALTQDDTVVYEDGFAQIELPEDEIVLVTEHDAYGFTVLTNRQVLWQEAALLAVLQDAFELDDQ